MVDAWGSGVFDHDQLGPPQLTVHDELDGSFATDKMDAVKELGQIMERTVELNVPLKCDVGTGPNWGDAE
jgi:DNA polymerase I-like protein with 3'-5' exonuclease and polymerase domains